MSVLCYAGLSSERTTTVKWVEDSMKSAISVENLSKMYRVGRVRVAKYQTLRETISDSIAKASKGVWLRLKGSRDREDALSGSEEAFWALKDMSFEVQPGEVIGIIGRNGAGKSTLLKILSRITEPTRGRVKYRGRIANLLEVGTGFHPELTGRENIFLNASIIGMNRREIVRKFDEIVAFSEIEQFLETPVKRYSSGMYVRLAFAVAAHLDPDILIIDEVLAVGDMQFQKKCLSKLKDVANIGRTVLFVTHNMQSVRQLCSRTILIQKGSMIYDGRPAEAISHYLGQTSNEANTFDLGRMSNLSGEKQASITKVKYFDSRGRSTAKMYQGERINIRAYLSTKVQLEKMDLAMAVVHRDGTRVFSMTLADQEGPASIAAGHYAIGFSFDLNYLRSDQYYLALNLSECGNTLDHIDGIPFPEIEDPYADEVKESYRWGIVRIPVLWQRPVKEDA